MPHLGFLEAGAIGLLQGVTELFPVSSLGHSVLIPAVIGGSWARDLDVSSPESPYLAFIVGLHVATAAALIVYFRRDWVRIVVGLLTSLRDREVVTSDQKLGWLLVIATIPVGVSGLLLEHTFRTTLGKPVVAAAFLTINGVVLLAAERMRHRPSPQDATYGGRHGAHRRPLVAASGKTVAGSGVSGTGVPGPDSEPGPQPDVDPAIASDQRLSRLRQSDGLIVGSAQILALAPGISRSGIAMVAGLLRGLSHEDAARFSFLLATPVILTAGVLKLPDLFGPLGEGIRVQALFGAALSGMAAFLSVRFLTRYFENRTLKPFAVYCIAAGLFCLARFTLF
ncbi:undecaprenyl-diphosphate phosphatase [Frankia sp. Cppng1_Ct_nod]|uniref:undecaprenyl-diphosphate phosphatase n=1 Tax=Frankia sp. Cppng1_Ct_nod TaxID=2897162 RepID=UPI00104111BA|nr:undecaprenyl-diphosphate phosphatase [Frankia sp. Cppng1_Ct_nod]